MVLGGVLCKSPRCHVQRYVPDCWGAQSLQRRVQLEIEPCKLHCMAAISGVRVCTGRGSSVCVVCWQASMYI